MTWGAVVGSALLLAGALVMLVACIGIVRMPDFYTRMHAATKAVSLGAGLMVTGVAAYFESPALLLRAGGVVLFLFLTLPVGAHLLGRAAYAAGVPLWGETHRDELRGAAHITRGPEQDRPDEDAQEGSPKGERRR